jgi:hypothetical protein
MAIKGYFAGSLPALEAVGVQSFSSLENCDKGRSFDLRSEIHFKLTGETMTNQSFGLMNFLYAGFTVAIILKRTPSLLL